MKKILTPSERRREKEKKRIISMYERFVNDYPNATRNHIYSQISGNIGCSLNKVRNVIMDFNIKNRCVMDG